MQKILLGAAAAALAIAALAHHARLVGQVHWPGDARERDPAPARTALAPALAPRPSAPVELVQRGELTRVLGRLPPATVVLDLEALESLDAALDLVDGWRRQHRGDAALSCWLALRADGEPLASAVDTLAAGGCTTLKVALPVLPVRSPALRLATGG